MATWKDTYDRLWHKEMMMMTTMPTHARLRIGIMTWIWTCSWMYSRQHTPTHACHTHAKSFWDEYLRTQKPTKVPTRSVMQPRSLRPPLAVWCSQSLHWPATRSVTRPMGIPVLVSRLSRWGWMTSLAYFSIEKWYIYVPFPHAFGFKNPAFVYTCMIHATPTLCNLMHMNLHNTWYVWIDHVFPTLCNLMHMISHTMQLNANNVPRYAT